MVRKILLFLVFALMLVNAVSAEAADPVITYTDLHITIKDIITNEIVPSNPVDLSFYNVNTGTTINLTDFTDSQGIIDYRINVGNWRLVIKMDLPDTPGMDYAEERTFLIEENTPDADETIYLKPVGSIEATVVNPNGELVSNADVTLKCKSYKTSIRTDQYGTVSDDVLPVGQCKIQAVFDDYAGASSVNITQGELSTSVIKLNRTVFSTTKRYIYWIFGVLGLAIILFGVYRITRNRIPKKTKPIKAKSSPRKRSEAKKKEEPAKKADNDDKEQKEEEDVNPRARDIIKTLNSRENKVVQFLMQEKDNKSTQAAIRNNTGIPKTSLARVFKSLESKNVLKIEVIGKLKKVELTQWFMGKE